MDIESQLDRMEQKLDYIYSRIKEVDDAKAAALAKQVGDLADLAKYIESQGHDHAELNKDSSFHQSLAEFFAKSGMLTPKQLATFPRLPQSTKPTVPDPIEGEQSLYMNDEIPF